MLDGDETIFCFCSFRTDNDILLDVGVFFCGIRAWSSGMRAGVIGQIGLGGGLLGWKDCGNYAMSVTIAGDRVDVCEKMF